MLHPAARHMAVWQHSSQHLLRDFPSHRRGDNQALQQPRRCAPATVGGGAGALPPQQPARACCRQQEESHICCREGCPEAQQGDQYHNLRGMRA